MGCPKKYSTGVANIKHYLKTKGIVSIRQVGQFQDVKIKEGKLEEFYAVVAKMKEHGLKEYGIETNWAFAEGNRVRFNRQAFKAIDILNGVPRYDHLDATPYLNQATDNFMSEYRKEKDNEEMLKKIKGEYLNDEYDSGDSYDPDFFTESSDIGAVLPEKGTQGLNLLIKLKQRLLSNAKHSLKQINAAAKEAQKDPVDYKSLISKKNALLEYIYGNRSESVQGLEDEIAGLKALDTKSPELIAPYIEKELSRLESLVVSDNPEDLKEARDTIQFIKAMSNFELNDATRHPIYDYNEMYNKDTKEFLFTEAMTKPFIDWAAKASRLGNTLTAQEHKQIEEIYNNNDNIKKMFAGKAFTYNEIVLAAQGLKDASWIDMMVMDISAGIRSHNGILPQVAKKIAEDAFQVATVWSKDIENIMDEILPQVEAEIKKLDGGKHSLSILGIKGVSYSWIKQIYRNGLETGNLASKYAAEWFDTLAEVRDAYKEALKKAYEYDDIVVRNKMIGNVNKERAKWINENTKVLNPGFIESIVSNPKFSAFSSHFGTPEQVATHTKEMITLVGKRHFDKMIEEQTNLLEEFMVQRQIYLEQRLFEAGVAIEDNLPPSERTKMKVWDEINSPFRALNYLETGKFFGTVEEDYYSNLKYTTYAPLRTSNDRETNFYDVNYEKVEENEILMKFYDIVHEATSQIRNSMDLDTQEKVLDTSVSFIHKSTAELLLDRGDIKVWQTLSETFRNIIDKIKMVAGVRRQDQFSFARINLITGQPEYQVSDQFLKQGANAIEQNFKLNQIKFLQDYNSVLGAKKLSKFTKFTHLALTSKNADSMAELLSPYLEGITGAKLLELYPDDRVPVGKIIQAYSQHQVAQEKSFDLPRIIKHFSYLSAQYEARQSMMPMVELLKRHYESIKAPLTQNTDEAITNMQASAPGENRSALGQIRVNANRQVDNWFQRVVLGKTGIKKHYGFIKKRELKLDDGTPEEEKDFLTKVFDKLITGDVTKNLMTHHDKKLATQIDDLISKETDEENLADLKAMRENLNRDFSLSGAVDNILNFVRFKALGFNISSGFTNVIEGQLANSIAASGSLNFPAEYIDTVTLSEMMYSDSMAKFNPKWALEKVRKYQVIMDKFDLLQDSKDELQKSSAKSSISGLSRLNPYYIQSKGESYNQIPLVAALLRDITIYDKNGDESNVGDALEVTEKGLLKLKEDFRTGEHGEENIQNWEKSNGKTYLNFKSKAEDLIKNTHGDYSKTSGMMAKSTHTGTIIMMFKTWLSREMYKRFAVEQDNTLSGIKGFKGRYHSHSSVTGLALGVGAGLLPFGIPGAVVFGGVGVFLGKGFGAHNMLSFAEESVLITKIMTRKILGFPVNFVGRSLGKGNLIEIDADKLAPDKMKVFTKDFTAMDFANWKMNIQETAAIYMWIGLLLAVKALTWDDDDDEKSKRRKAHNLLANKFMGLAQSLTQYSNPLDLYKTISNIALLRILTDATKLLGDLSKEMSGQGLITSGEHTGEHKAVRQFKKTFLPPVLANPFSFGFETQTERQFAPSPVDSWFWGEEKSAKTEVGQIRAEAKKELKENYNAKKFAKKKGESYSELAVRLLKPGFLGGKE